MTETITRLRPTTTVDRYGNTTKNWGTPNQLDITGCMVAPRLDEEDATNGREGRVIGWTVYAPAGADVLATDRLDIRGEQLDVDGEPGDWGSGFSAWQPGVEIQTRRGVG